MYKRHPTHPRAAIAWRRSAAAAALCLAALQAVAAADPKAAGFYEDALTRFEARDFKGAIVQLKNALQIDKTMLPVQVLLGKALLASGDVAAAEVALEEALRLGVNRAEVVLPLAEAVVAQGKPGLLLEQPRFADAGLPPGTRVQLLVLRAAAAVDTGDARAAMKAVEDARAIDPARPESWLAEVPIRLRARQLKQAQAAADKAVALDPQSAMAHYLRGTVAHAQGDRDAAIAAYDTTLRLRPAHTEALVSRAGLRLDMGRLDDARRDVAELRRSARLDPRGAYLAALIAEKTGDAAAARAGLQDVTQLLDPVPQAFLRYRPQLLILGGLSHHGLNQREKAVPYLEMVQRSQPGSAVAKLLAQIYLGQGKFDRAIESLDTYLRSQPNDTQAMHLLASAHMTQGRYVRATGIMQEALRKDDSPASHSLLGLSLVGSGKIAGAVEALEAAFKADPAQLQAGTALVSIYMQTGQAGSAVRTAEALVQRKPAHAGLQNLLGAARMRAGNAAGARQAFDAALALDAAYTAPKVNLARLDIDANALDSAAARLNAILAKDEKYIEALLEMARVQERRGLLPDAQRFLEKADDHSGSDNFQAAQALVDFHLRRKQPQAAREALRRMTARAPEATPVLLATARVSLANADLAGAKTALTRAANGADYDAPLLVRIAMLQLEAGHTQGAAYSLSKALAERPGFMPAQALMADVEIRQGNLPQAEALARQIAASHPRLGLGAALSGDVALARGQRAAALEAYRRAHQLDASTESLLRLVRVQMQSDPAGALQLAGGWLKTRPKDVAVRRALADGLARGGNLPAARAAYEALLQVAPADSEALNNLANVLVLLNDPLALPTAEKALAQQPGAPHIIGTTGWAAFKAGQPDRALQLLRDARLRDPANADTRYFLGAVLASKGRTSEAREELQGALGGGRAFAGAAQAEALLRTLK